MHRVFTYKTILWAAGVSFLVAQATMWAVEIRAAGFRQWWRDGATKSYVQYFLLLPRTRRLRLLTLWGLVFLLIMLMLVVI